MPFSPSIVTPHIDREGEKRSSLSVSIDWYLEIEKKYIKGENRLKYTVSFMVILKRVFER